MTKPERHLALCKTLNVVYKQNYQNYGDSFHITFQEEGYAMARIRLTDKLNRFKTLSRNPNLDSADKSITDTLLDIANYALMTVLEIRESKGYDEPDGKTISRPQEPIDIAKELFLAMNGSPDIPTESAYPTNQSGAERR